MARKTYTDLPKSFFHYILEIETLDIEVDQQVSMFVKCI